MDLRDYSSEIDEIKEALKKIPTTETGEILIKDLRGMPDYKLTLREFSFVFTRKFEQQPEIFFSVQEFDIGSNDEYHRYSIEIHDISSVGFTAKVFTWHVTHIYTLKIKWLAIEIK